MSLVNVEKLPKLEVSFKSIFFGLKIGTSHRINNRLTNKFLYVFLIEKFML